MNPTEEQVVCGKSAALCMRIRYDEAYLPCNHAAGRAKKWQCGHGLPK
ncbi:hypothetical protein M8PIadj_0020 [Bifidobacterium animalis]|nr:hypothetical protein M8PIadj_0020 [Bifidobacterium animalis]